MAKLRTGSSKKNSGIKIVFKKIQKSLLLGKKHNLFGDECEETRDDNVPEDVKEGHVAVLAMEEGGEPPKRFIVPLSYLTHPTFMRLLEQAAEEYGFDREGALTIPCRPSELEKLLSHHQDDDDDGLDASSHVSVKWSSRNPMVESC